MDPLEIIAKAEQVVEDIRSYSRSQKEFWQKIPLLALEANGKDGFSDNYSRAYENGFWALNRSVYVDLATGELVDAYDASSSFSICDVDVPKDPVISPAESEKIIKLAFNLRKLDAQKIVSLLEEKANQEPSSFYDSKKQEVWRNKIRAERNLLEFYVR